MIIYLVRNNINHKFYIGKTKFSLEHRKAAHIRSILKYDTKHNRRSLFYNAMKKYGYENFSWEIIDSCNSVDELNKLEKHYIKLYNSQNRSIGYNINEGGEGGDCLSTHPDLELIKQKISKAKTGHKMSEEFKIKNRERQIGQKRSVESIEKTATALRGKPLSLQHKKALSDSLKGRTISNDIKQKISKSLKGKKQKKRAYKKRLPLSNMTKQKIKDSWINRKEKGLFNKQLSINTRSLMSLRRKILCDKNKFMGNKIKVAIFGGAFDPITYGHVYVANVLLEQNIVDQIWFCPCHQHQFDKQMCDITHRINMIKIATRYNKKNAMKFNGPKKYILSYENFSTYDFIKKLLTEIDIDIYDLSIVIGLDNALNFCKWKNFEELQHLIKFIVVPRKNYILDTTAWFLKLPHMFLSTVKEIACSSTHVRNVLKTEQLNTMPEKLKTLMDIKVFNYIVANELYK